MAGEEKKASSGGTQQEAGGKHRLVGEAGAHWQGLASNGMLEKKQQVPQGKWLLASGRWLIIGIAYNIKPVFACSEDDEKDIVN